MKKRILSFFICLTLISCVFSCLPAASTTEVSAATTSQTNMVKRADALYACRWTSMKSISSWKSNSTFTKGSTYRVPYGQPVTSGKYVCYGVTPVTFMQSTLDATSVFYTSKSYYSGNSGSYAPYYANDCSAFVSYCWGIGRTTTSGLGSKATSKGKCTSANVDGIQIGDALNLSGSHVVIVTDATYSGSTISSIEITEQTPPQLKRTTYTRSSLISKYSSYTILRYTGSVSAPTFTAAFNANGGTGTMSNQTITYGTSTALSANKFKRAGYSFKGWYAYRNTMKTWIYENSAGTTGWYKKGSQPSGYSLKLYTDKTKVEKTGYGISDTVTYYAQWTKNPGEDGTFIFQFDANGGTGTMADQVITYGTSTKISKNTFTKEGYTFKGWRVYRTCDDKYRYTNGTSYAWYQSGSAPKDYYYHLYKDGGSVSSTGEGTGDVVKMTAMWGKNNYVIKYLPNGGTGTMADSAMIYGISRPLSTNTFTRSGYTFKGWYLTRATDGKMLYSTTDGSTSSIWYVPGSQPAGYRVSLYTDNRTVSQLTSTEGGVINCTAQWVPVSTGTTTFYADFNANGGTGTMAQQKIVKGTSSSYTVLSKNKFTREDYKFTGWIVHRRNDNKWRTINGDDTSYYVSSASITDSTQFYVYEDQNKIWGTSSVDCDVITFYAQWEYIPNFIFQFNANGGTGTMSNQKIVYGTSTAITANKFTREGYTFKGWYAYRVGEKKYAYAKDGSSVAFYAEGSQPSGYTKYVYSNKQSVAKTGLGTGDTVRLYAVWEPISYNIAFDGNGGTGSMSNVSTEYDSAVELAKNTFKKDDADFAGWIAKRASDSAIYCVNTKDATDKKWLAESDITGDYEKYVFADGESVKSLATKSNDTVNLSAVWDLFSYKIKFDANGGTGDMTDLDVLCGNSVDLTVNNFQKGDSKFVGWIAERLSDGAFYCINKNDSTDGQWLTESSITDSYEKCVFSENTSITNFDIADDDTVTMSVVWDLFGDVNGDNKLDISDVTEIQKIMVNTPFSEFDSKWDVNGDGVFSIRDATMIQLYLTNLVSALPVCK